MRFRNTIKPPMLQVPETTQDISNAGTSLSRIFFLSSGNHGGERQGTNSQLEIPLWDLGL